tara:strand:+ start:1556 stop:1978 length:423 start_codon:yes stop_codon:yes gene_type:complete
MKREFCENIGLVICSFGEVEFITYRMWSVLNMELDPPNSFKARVDKLIGRLKVVDPSSTKIQALLIDAKKLYDHRNSVAHNPIWSQEKGYVIFVEGKEDALELECLKKLHKDIYELSNNLWKENKYFSGEFKYPSNENKI